MKRLVLAGGGHGHLAFLHALARQPLAGVQVQLVVPHPRQFYSGMLPGWMAGAYTAESCVIDLEPLAARADVELIIDRVGGMDAGRRCVALSDGRHLEYDLLSLDVGSESDLSCLEAAGPLLMPVRPLDTFVACWPKLLDEARRRGGCRLAVIGAGAAGVELAFAAQYALARLGDVAVTVVASERGLLPGHAPAVVARVRRLLQERGIDLVQGLAAGVEKGLQLASGRALPVDAVIAATGARAPCWLRLSGLALDRGGFVLVGPTHASLSHPDVFAVGDVCARHDLSMCKSGVHAVHAGRVLAQNLAARLSGESLKSYTPRRRSLYLLATQPGHAVLSWGGLSTSGAWVWRWKDHIDRGYVARQQRVS